MNGERGILTINDGHPFGWIDDLIFGARGFGTAMYVLGACACLARFQARTNPDYTHGTGESGMEAVLFQTPRGGWGRFLGIGNRTAWRYLAQLEREGRIEKYADAPGKATVWALPISPLDKRENGEPARRIELAPMGDPEWCDGTRAVWVALCRYARLPERNTCNPAIGTLAKDSGIDRRNVQRQIRRMVRGGYLAQTFRRRSSTFTLYPTGNAPKVETRATIAAPPVPPAPPHPCHKRRPTRATSAAPPVPPAPPEVEPWS